MEQLEGQVTAERVRYAPVIGSGPLPKHPSASSGPLVPEPPAGVPGSLVPSGQDGPPQATGSGHAVPEFLAGVAQMVQTLAGAFPMDSMPERSVGEALGMAQALAQAAESLVVMTTREAVTRGLPTDSGHSVSDWITTWAPDMLREEALATARVAEGMGDERLDALSAKVADGTARRTHVNMVERFVQDMTPVADAESLAAITTLLTDNINDLSTRHLGLAIQKARLSLKKPDDDDDEAEKEATRRLFRRIGKVAGLAEWQLLLDAEAEAVLEAALDPLSAPRPGGDEHGATRLDPRTAAQRRADALVEILTRAGCTDDADAPTSGAGQILVTTSLDALAGKVPGGGTDERGHHLSAGALRRLACDANLYPIVLGGPSEPLDVGRVKRLFTPGQRKAVYLRDRQCSFPGCTVPPAWCQIHHVLHWVFGGDTDLLNAAALCQRHHTLVHKYGYTATVTETGVIWHIPEPVAPAWVP